MSHALLLRLFLSPSFFSVNVALQYLNLYHNSIGITYYLTRRLKEFNSNELRDVWGFICHLLVTKPSKSRALECFVVDTCERSTHMAMFTLWFMQAHLRDLALSSKDSKSFVVCQRILHRCHEIIFEDSPGLVTGPYSTIKVRSRKFTRRNRVKHHLEPALVGIGCVLVGAPGLPPLAEIVGNVAIEQGRGELIETAIRSLEPQSDESPVPSSSVHLPEDPGEEDLDGDEQLYEISQTGERGQENLMSKEVEGGNDHLLFKALPPSQEMREAAQTTPAFSTLSSGVPRSEAADDPFGQLDVPPSSIPPFKSSPAISGSKRTRSSGSSNLIDNIMREYDIPTQRHLLQGHYCRAEIQFILTLENISNHLLVIPKPARVSALRAELTSLNHKLPAEVCMPMWCSGFDSLVNSKGSPQPHHRIVRVPPGESVVLNSAERAPFLLLLEILHDDLDFDPTKRSNRELLKDVIKKELHSAKVTGRDFSLRETSDAPVPVHISSAVETLDSDAGDMNATFWDRNTTQSPVTDASEINGEEEVDLVEQVYGEDLSVHQTPDLSESLVVPSPPKNRALDIATWSRSASLPSSPALTPALSNSDTFGTGNHRPLSSRPQENERSSQGSSGSIRLPVLSLDEYSQRMRTAAVMLAQLNASLVKEMIIPTPFSEYPSAASDISSAGSNWFPIPNWLSGVNTPSSSGPLHPSLSGTASDSSRTSSAGTGSMMRMKLQPSEVAAIRERIMQEMLALEEERMGRMQVDPDSDGMMGFETVSGLKTAEDEQIIRRVLNRDDPSAVVFQESWAAKRAMTLFFKSRIRQGSPYGHLASWDCVSVIVKTGADLRQEQLAIQMIQEFEHIWKEENCQCWVRPFQILITGGSSGLVETITDAVSVHSIKKALYARRLTDGRLGQVSLLDHFTNSYGDRSSAKFARAQRNFVRSLAGYSVITYLLQIKDRHNGNILLDRDGHLVHIDFGFMLSNSPGNIGFEAAPFKLTFDYVEVLGGVDSTAFREFKRLFHEGFEAARKHCDRIITIVELMQRDSSLPCFAALGEQTAQQLRDRFQLKSSQQSAAELVERMIMSSLGSNWTRLYDSYQYYSQSIL
ncbi:kinase-like domain-containing protein, partial [Phellopilus nigrolimitatus]